MSLRNLTDPAAVERAMAEFDALGREAFLERYGFAPSTRFLLVHDDPIDGVRYYDSKAIVGVAHRHQHGRALAAKEFSGGRATVVRTLERLGFEILDLKRTGSSERREPPGVSTSEDRPPRGQPAAKVSRRELLDPFTPEPPRSPTRPFAPIEVDPAAHDRANEIHEDTRLTLARQLAGLGLTLRQGRQEHRAELLFDLAVEHGDFTWLVEVKSLPDDRNDHPRLRAGLGQVLWYRSRWRRRCTDPCIAVLCVARRPVAHEQWQQACAEVNVLLTWPERFGTLLTECLTLERRTATAPSPTPALPEGTPRTPPR